MTSIASYNGAWLQAHWRWQAAIRDHMRQQSSSVCSFSMSPLQHLEFQERNSASATIIGFAKLPAIDALMSSIHSMHDRDAFNGVTVKISFANKPSNRPNLPDGNSLDFERDVIRETFRRMLDHRWCPNVVAPLAEWHCTGRLMADTDNHNRTQKLFETLAYRLGAIQKSHPSYMQPSYTLVMERGTDTLGQLLDGTVDERIGMIIPPELDDDDFYAMMFQCYYTLECFYRLGVRHNDLHLDNILYRKLEVPEDLLYEIEMPGDRKRIVVHLRTRYIIKFFDMDYGSVYSPRVRRNVALDVSACVRVGRCAGLYSRADVGAFTLGIMDAIFQTWLGERNEWANREGYNRFTFFQTHLSNPSVWEEFGVLDASAFIQNWMHTAAGMETHNIETGDMNTALKYRQMIDSVLSPQQCMNVLVTEGKVRFLAHDSDAARALLSNYAMGHQPFSLPAQVSIQLGSPRRSMLGSKYVVEASPVTSHSYRGGQYRSLPNFGVMAFEGVSHFNGNVSNNRWWLLTFDQWRQELKNSGVNATWKWEEVAAQLWRALQTTSVRCDNTHQLQILATACLILTCPMYYGFDDTMRRHLRSTLGRQALMDATVVDVDQLVLASEMQIWQTFDNVLPVDIPLLYDMAEP